MELARIVILWCEELFLMARFIVESYSVYFSKVSNFILLR